MFFMREVKQPSPRKSTLLFSKTSNIDGMEDVSDRIKKLRKDLGLTQEAFGLVAGVTKQAVSQWERGLTTPERDALRRLKDSRRVNPDWVSQGTGTMLISSEFLAQTAPATPARPPIIDDNDWRALPPKTRALIEDVIQKTALNSLDEDDIKLLSSTLDRLAKK